MKFVILKAYKVIDIGNNLSFVPNENINEKKIKRLLRVVFTPNVVAFDSGIPSLSTSTNVHIILDDINDCIPNFSQSEYNFTIVEDFMQNYTGPRIIGMVVATDCDIGLNSMLIYSLLDPGLPFEVS
ncbi:unnamed protein product [Schistosoma curassoni]|uniref:Cadherin domain-containing protein n=1 Tax=Schistosoma curassoni TaxID=6186 RepID=A0A183KWN6_9TREM|nr:unnamed protein product [Schistosoma curassoni]